MEHGNDLKFKTLKAAYESGFKPIPRGYYGGTQIFVKGRILAKEPIRAKSKTEWGKLGFNVRDDAEPHDVVHTHSHGRSLHYPVYRDDQVLAKNNRRVLPPVNVPVLAALWTVNRRAKRARDLARKAYESGMHGIASLRRAEKERCYDIKEQSLHWLLQEGRLSVTGYHLFDSSNWAEVLEGDGYTFHRPCHSDAVPEYIAANPATHSLEGIEAKPKCDGETRLSDAVYTLEVYLKGRPHVESYGWPERPRLIDVDV